MIDTELEERASQGDSAAQVSLAQALDRAGRHSEAIDWLARAARSQSAPALWLLGRRLLTGEKAPHLPSHAIGLLHDAALGGSADAALLNSVLAAAGVHREASWADAVKWLALAAEQGSAPASQQLQLIAGGQALPDDVATSSDLRLDHWLEPAAGRPLHDAPRLIAYERVVDRAVCDWLMSLSSERLGPAYVYETASGRVGKSDMRTNQVARFGLLETSLLHILVQAKIAATVGVPLDRLEAFSVLHYAVGQEAKEHADYIDPAAAGAAEQIARSGQRVATALLYLNDDYTGGETEFPQLGISHRGKAGDVLVFFGTDENGVPDPRSIHAGRPPRSGEKWVLSQFIRNRRMIPG